MRAVILFHLCPSTCSRRVGLTCRLVAFPRRRYRLERSDDPNSLQSDAANDDTAEESGKSLKRTTRDDGTEVLADDAHGEERGDKRTRGNDSKRGKAKGMNKGRLVDPRRKITILARRGSFG